MNNSANTHPAHNEQNENMRENAVLCVDSQGLHRMAYTEWGDRDNPNVLICVHGLTRNGRDFDELARAMMDKYRVICPDVVGRGRSDWLEIKTEYAFPQYVSDMVTLIARLNVEKLHWLGTSMGGIIGMVLANFPDSPVTRLILNDVGPEISGAALRRIGDYVGRTPKFENMKDAEAWVREICAPFGKLSDAQWQHLTRYSMRSLENGSFTINYDQGIGDVFRSTPVIGDVDMWSTYENIKCPTLVVRGAESDLLTRQTTERMKKTGPKARVAEIEGVGHAPALMDAEQISLIRNFLLEK